MIKMRLALLVVCLFFIMSCSAEPAEQPATPTVAAPATAVPTIVPTTVPTTVPTPTAAAEEPQPAADLAQFLDELAVAVAARDFETLGSQMSFPFALGAWRSEWSTYASSGEVQTYFDTYYAADHPQEFHPLTVAEATQLLGGQDASGLFGPDVTIAGFLHSTGWGDSGDIEALLIVVETEDGFSWQGFLYTVGPFAQPELEVIAPPVGLIFHPFNEGVYQIQSDGRLVQILDGGLGSAPNLLVAPDGRHAVYNDDARQLWLIDSATLEQEPIGDANLAAILNWGDSSTLFVGTWLSDAESEGPNSGHLTLINIDEREAVILDKEHLSTNRPAYSPADGRIAFEIIPNEGETLNGRIYDPETGIEAFDPADFSVSGQAVEGPVFNPSWSPDGQYLSWMRSTGDRTFLQVFDLEAKTAVTIHDWDPARFGATVPSPSWSPDGQWLALEIWANGLEGSGVWLLAADGSSQMLINAEGHLPLWLNENQLVYIANGQSILYEVSSGESFRLDLPEGSVVLGLAEDVVTVSGATAPELPQIELPDPETLTSMIEQLNSPDGRWQATIAQSEPIVTNDGELFYTSLTVTDGTDTWQPLAEWRAYGLGYAFPVVYQWSADGGSLYFANNVAGGGCTLFANATDLYRLDLSDGTVETVLDTGLTFNIGLSPDETKLAYTMYNGQGIVLAVVDLVNGAEGSVITTEDSIAMQAGSIVWSPDSNRLVFTVAHDPCGQNWTHSIVQVDAAALTATAVLEKDARRFVSQEWSEPDLVLLSDKDNARWMLYLDSGELTPQN